MKTNFKKMALVAGVSAAMAGGSMSAHAVIQAISAPAQLVPFVATYDEAVTTFRIEVPASVGVDTVINLFGGPNTDDQSKSPAGLATSVPGNALAAPDTTKIHWIYLDRNSNEIRNGKFPVSANDVVEFDTTAVPYEGGTLRMPEGVGYFLFVNETAYEGGAPVFSFNADAYIAWEADNDPIPEWISNIPTYPLTDAADDSAAAEGAITPTLLNNVVERRNPNSPAASPFGDGPIASPIISGIRTGASDANGKSVGFRVIDFPVTNQFADLYVVWSDRNASFDFVEGEDVPALSGNTLIFDCNEAPLSGPTLSFEDQLNFLVVRAGANFPMEANLVREGGRRHRMGITDVYAQGAYGAPGSACANTGGFLRWMAKPGVNYANTIGDAYQSSVIVRIQFPFSADAFGFSQNVVDRGFFAKQ